MSLNLRRSYTFLFPNTTATDAAAQQPVGTCQKSFTKYRDRRDAPQCIHKAAPSFLDSLLPEAVVEEGEDLLEPLRAELLHPLQVVVGQRHPQRLDAGVLLLRAQVRVALKV